MELKNLTICTINMRGGSKGVPNKNLRLLNGKPLMAYSIEQALESQLFDHVVVSTDSNEIANKAKSYGAEAWFLRPVELATDTAPKIPAIRHALLEAEIFFKKRYEYIVDLDATSPLRSVDDIINSFLQFINDRADILITACLSRKNPYFNMIEKVDGEYKRVKILNPWVTRRQDAPTVYDINASIYIWKRDSLLTNDTLYTKNTSLYVMPEERSVDIDSKMDWQIVEYLMEKQGLNGN